MSVSFKSTLRFLPLAASVAMAGCFGGGDPDPAPEGQALTNPGDYDYNIPETSWTSEEAFSNEFTFYKSGARDATYNPHGVIIDCIETWPRDLETPSLVALYDYPRG